MKLYVCGPMTGISDFNFPAFHQATEQLTKAGFEVLNPARNEPDKKLTWADYLRRGLADVVTVDGIALLPGWEESKGALLEVFVAEALELPYQSVAEWLTDWLDE